MQILHGKAFNINNLSIMLQQLILSMSFYAKKAAKTSQEEEKHCVT